MAQIFRESANRVPALLAVAVVVLGALSTGAGYWLLWPDTRVVGYQPTQPVAFSHALHAGELKMDCRYCHYQVERSPVAAVPATSICMNCHSLVGRDLASLAPVRDSASSGEPLRWVRVHNLPDFARFDHSLHLAAGIGCSSCHGDVRSMEVVRHAEPLNMGWCLDCHRDPAPHRRPASELTDTTWTPPADQAEIAARLGEENPVAPPTVCSGCHQ